MGTKSKSGLCFPWERASNRFCSYSCCLEDIFDVLDVVLDVSFIIVETSYALATAASSKDEPYIFEKRNDLN